MQTEQRRVLFVLGMHRSGTSAVMRGLAALGVEPGENLLPPMPGVNPHGFYEHATVVELDRRLLAAAGNSRLIPGAKP